MFLDRISASAVLRLWGAVLLVGAIYIIFRGRIVGYFSLPTIVLGLIAGPGMLGVCTWARWPAALLFAYWLILGSFLVYHTWPVPRGFSLIFAGLCGLAVIWRWSYNRVWVYSSKDLTRRSS